ncbi:MAG TPA: asparaginase [Clostridiaceae bacterium]|jgi:L-asparaginase|nr:asparaginase [Clostridiaceae bacterium]
MKHIALLTTGGTIASQLDEETGLQIAGTLTGEAIFAASGIDPAKFGLEVSVHSIFQLPSSSMDFDRNDEMIRRMEMLRAEGADGFVITHGTDAMEETVYYLDLHWPFDEPVVVTGSQFDPAAHNTDAFHNLLTALRVAASEASQSRGAQLVFNDTILNARYVTKWHTSNISAFGAPVTGPDGVSDVDRIHYYAPPRPRTVFPVPAGSHADKRVEIVPCYVGADPDIITYHAEKGAAGLVIEGFGRGQLTIALADKAKAVMANGLPVVITSACMNGYVAPIYGYDGSFGDLMANGAIGGGDFGTKKARILLHSLFMAGIAEPSLIAEAFRQ